jgi:hypothetical protein
LIEFRNSVSEISPWPYHNALFFIQLGTFSAFAKFTETDTSIITDIEIENIFKVKEFILMLKS